MTEQCVISGADYGELRKALPAHIELVQHVYPVTLATVPETDDAVDEVTRLLNAAGVGAYVEKPAPPAAFNTTDYRIAPGGEGPHAATWKDKPHRLIYDLCREIERLQSE